MYRFLTNGNAEYHLWFLHALIVAVLLLTVFINIRWNFVKILALAGILHIIALLGGGYYFVYLYVFPEGSSVYQMLHGMTKFLSTTNGFTVGFLYVSIGAWVGFYRPCFTRTFLYRGFCLSWIFFVAEAALIKLYFPFIEGSTPYIFLIPATVFTFLLGLDIEVENKPVYMVMRKMSMFVYFLHPWFLFLISGIAKIIHPMNSLAIFAVVIVLTVLSARMIVIISSRDKKGWLAILG